MSGKRDLNSSSGHVDPSTSNVKQSTDGSALPVGDLDRLKDEIKSGSNKSLKTKHVVNNQIDLPSRILHQSGENSDLPIQEEGGSKEKVDVSTDNVAEPTDPSDPSTDVRTRPSHGYEYLDHPADVQLHAWGSDLEEAFEQVILAMFGYMTDLTYVECVDVRQVTADGHDACSLLYAVLDEFLFGFSAEPYFVASRVRVYELDRQRWRARIQAHGETFRLDKHPQGTEIKAITYSNMQVHDTTDRHEVFVIVDI